MQRVARLCARQEMERCRPGKTITKKCGCSEIAGAGRLEGRSSLGSLRCILSRAHRYYETGRLDEPYRSRYAL